MLRRTEKLWASQDRHIGDRARLFAAVADHLDVATALYPGSFVDLAPSFVWPSVTYVDVDRRADQFFADTDGIDELLRRHDADPTSRTLRFVRADYQDALDLDPDTFDLLISLYAGFVSEHCTEHLRVGGHLLVNSSHGDAAMASIDDRYRLCAVVLSRSGGYTVSAAQLDTYLIPKRPIDVTGEYLHEWGRGVAYTTSPFAYLFERIC